MWKRIARTIIFNEHGGNPEEEEEEEDPEEEVKKIIGFVVVFFTLILYIVIGTFMEKMHFPVGHETGMIILVGIVISIVTTLVNPKAEFLKWNNDLFFFVLLPLIIFATGYNMRRKNFFANMANVAKFGLIGTTLTFVLYSIMMSLLFRFGTMWKYDPKSGKTTQWKLDTASTLFMCAILSSSDIIAAVTLVSEEEQPKLFSIILGEGLFNDAVAIILYQTFKEVVEEAAGREHDAASETKFVTPLWVLKVFGKFLWLCTASILIGLFFGILCTLMTKKFRFIAHSAIHESALFLCFAMMSYFTSEAVHMSAIVSLLATSLIMSHYAWYNLSPQGKHVTSVTFQTLGFIAEAVVFGYVGITAAYEWLNYERDLVFVVIGFFVVIIGRFGAIYITYYMFACVPGDKRNKLTFPQLTFCSYAALIRGAIAFGLIQNLSWKNFGRFYQKPDGTYDHQSEVQVVQSSVLYLVILTTVVIGGLTPPIQKALLTPENKREKIIALHQEQDAPRFGVATDSAEAAGTIASDEFGEEVMVDALNQDGSTLKEKFIAKHITSKLPKAEPPSHDINKSATQQDSLQASGHEDTSVTHYGQFQHPNLESQSNEDEPINTKSCLYKFNYFDDKYVRPFLVYKYDKVKMRPEFEVKELLDEYKQIEEELNNEEDELLGTDDNADRADQSKSFSALYMQAQVSRQRLSSRGAGGIAGPGLLSTYINSRMINNIARRGTHNNIGLGNQSISISRGVGHGNQSISLRQGPGGSSTTLKLVRFGSQNSVAPNLTGMRTKLGAGTNPTQGGSVSTFNMPKVDSDQSTQAVVFAPIAEEDEDGPRDSHFPNPQSSAPGYGEGPLGKKQSLVAMIKEQSAQASNGSTAGQNQSLATDPLIKGSIQRSNEHDNHF